MESLRTPCEGAHFEHVRGCSNKHAVRLRRQRRRSPTAPLTLCWDAQVTHIIAVWTQWSVDCTCTCRDLSRSVISLYRYRFYCPSTAFERVVFFFFYFFVSLHSRLLHSFAFPLVSLASIKGLRGLGFWRFWKVVFFLVRCQPDRKIFNNDCCTIANYIVIILKPYIKRSSLYYSRTYSRTNI